MHTSLDAKKITKNDLTHYFAIGCKNPSDFRVGVEWEKIGVHRETGEAISYSGKRGVLAIFKALSERFSWVPIRSTSGHPIALKKGASNISLEPGGQIELSGQAWRHLEENEKELYSHLNELKQVSDELGIVWLGLGVQPISQLESIEWVPKDRYKIMRQVLEQKGSMTHRMMKETASIQASFDYSSEEDAAIKLRLAMCLSPFVAAIFSNSPLLDGRPSGFFSKRYQIWQNTAPERTGLIKSIFQNKFTFEDYANYAFEVPLLFIQREGKWISPPPDMTFRDFFEKGLSGHQPIMEDWELHLTTIFTDSRLKQYIEIRSADCQKKEMGLSVPALLKGLLYDDEARRQLLDYFLNSTYEEIQLLRQEIPARGLNASFRGESLYSVASRWIDLAGEGLRRLEESGLAAPFEYRYLDPIRRCVVDMHKMPAEILLDCYRSASTEKQKLEKILKCAEL